jgi:type IV pilus assembly protein PilX
VSRHRSKRTASIGAAPKQAGVVLLMVLVVLVVLSLATVWAVKASISSEQLGNNIRISNSVNELAETALRYCENAVLSNTAALVVIAAPVSTAAGTLPTAWATTSNWIATPSKINTVPSAQLQDAMGRSPTIAPACMVEEVRMPPSDAQRQQAFLITARAFSEDFRANSLTGAVQAGSDVWLQSTIRF